MGDHGTVGVRRRSGRVWLAPLGGLVIAALIAGGPLMAGGSMAGGHRTTVGTAVDGHVTLAASKLPAALADMIARIDEMGQSGPSPAEYGVAVLDRSTHRLTLGAEGDVPFYSASVVKLFTVTSILHRVEAGEVRLSPAQRTQIQRALHVSDNASMNALWTAFGGTRTVTDMVALAGLHETRPPENPGEWGETRISARDVVAVYEYMLTQLDQSDRDLVLTSLATPGVAGSDGFNQSFGVIQQPGMSGAAGKQGWMVDKGHLYLHSTGLLGAKHRYVVALLSKQAGSVDYPEGRKRLDSAVGAIGGVLGLLRDVGIPGNAL
ncbi:MAG TPA: serine hydrolase [Pseudonocardia sp.]|nr:serine hydrolase [Pseudonocardia sp.]